MALTTTPRKMMHSRAFIAPSWTDIRCRTNIQVYAGVASPFNFNALVRHEYLRRGSNFADLQVNLSGKFECSLQSHEIEPRSSVERSLMLRLDKSLRSGLCFACRLVRIDDHSAGDHDSFFAGRYRRSQLHQSLQQSSDSAFRSFLSCSATKERNHAGARHSARRHGSQK